MMYATWPASGAGRAVTGCTAIASSSTSTTSIPKQSTRQVSSAVVTRAAGAASPKMNATRSSGCLMSMGT